MSFVIISETTRKISGGKIVEEAFHYVADETSGALVGRKAHAVMADAEAELAGLAGLSEGMEFANAQFPNMTDKARVGKANVISEYLSWVAAGKPVKTADEAEASDEAVDANGEIPVDETF